MLVPHLPAPLRRPRARAACRARGSERGMGLIEVALALLVIAVATLGSVSWTLSGMSLEAENRERADAHDAMRVLFEELQAVPFEEVFARFNADPADDPDGEGTARGGLFSIEPNRKDGFLDPARVAGGSTVAYRSNPLEVRVEFPVDAFGQLDESAQGADWGGRAWDLDGNGAVETGGGSTGYVLLPVRIRIRWQGHRGTRSVEHVRLLSRRPQREEGS